MHLTYQRLSQQPRVFIRLTGVSLATFEQILTRIEPGFAEIAAQKLLPGRPSRLASNEDKLLCVLLYYRTYVSHVFMGYLFNLHNSNICRLIKKVEPLLAKQVSIKKDRSLTAEKVLKLLADVTETPTQRPTNKQKKSYSGKKKRHTITEIVMEDRGKIVSVSKSHKGRTHDFKIRKAEKPLPINPIKLADSGYQGWQKLQRNVVLPYKKSKKKPLSKQQKEHNKQLSSMRMQIEHKIREIKIFKIIGEVYRNFQKKYNLRFNIIAGIVNIKYGF
jgi:hypothetical protein